jgi:transposase
MGGAIMIPSGVEIFVGLAPIDLRWGFDRIAGLVEEQIGRAARSGALFVFFGKRKSSLKILFLRWVRAMSVLQAA